MNPTFTRRQMLLATACTLLTHKAVLAASETSASPHESRTPPSHDSRRYKQWLQRDFLFRIGVALPAFQMSEDRLWIAYVLRRLFWRDLGLAERPDLPITMPRFFWPRGYELPSFDVTGLSQQLAALRQPQPEPWCGVEHNIHQLTALLHLRPSETALLELAHASSVTWKPVSNAPDQEISDPALYNLLMCLNWHDKAERNLVFSLLLDVPAQDVTPLLEEPNTLLALGLIDNASWQQGNGAFAYAEATDKLLAMLEKRCVSRDALLTALKAPLQDRILAADSDVPDGMLYEPGYLPRQLAEAYIAARRSRCLTTDQLTALVCWQTGFNIATEAVQALDQKLRFEAVRQTLADAVLARRKVNARVTPQTLIHALCTAASAL
jgi:hypothetical protein